MVVEVATVAVGAYAITAIVVVIVAATEEGMASGVESACAVLAGGGYRRLTDAGGGCYVKVRSSVC